MKTIPQALCPNSGFKMFYGFAGLSGPLWDSYSSCKPQAVNEDPGVTGASCSRRFLRRQLHCFEHPLFVAQDAGPVWIVEPRATGALPTGVVQLWMR